MSSHRFSNGETPSQRYSRLANCLVDGTNPIAYQDTIRLMRELQDDPKLIFSPLCYFFSAEEFYALGKFNAFKASLIYSQLCERGFPSVPLSQRQSHVEMCREMAAHYRALAERA